MSHPEPAVFVIFEDAGDRARRKRMPSLYNASPDGLLPDRFKVLGVGRGDMSEEAFDGLLKVAKSHGGLVSSRATRNGQEPYELNISYFDAINDPNAGETPLAVKRFMASQAIMLTLKGVPGVYVLSLLGSRNNLEGVRASGTNRMINREKFQAEDLETALADAGSLRHQVLSEYLKMLNLRKRTPAFHPSGRRRVLDSDRRLLVISRSFKGESLEVLINVSEEDLLVREFEGRQDLLNGKRFDGKVEGYGVYFLPQ